MDSIKVYSDPSYSFDQLPFRPIGEFRGHSLFRDPGRLVIKVIVNRASIKVYSDPSYLVFLVILPFIKLILDQDPTLFVLYSHLELGKFAHYKKILFDH